ncbi:MAG: hypothetical protein IT537_03325 [Hyphomicrobiales bacterium]|nr:hypothetical protein [Hyphomicrobiales bacterium]
MTDNPLPPTAIELAAALRDGRASVEADQLSLSWDCDYMSSGAVWPDTVITITMGDWSTDVPVWLVASYSHGDWSSDSSDGQGSGEPRTSVEETDDNMYVVSLRGGDNISSTLELDAGADLDAATTAASYIEGALMEVYETISVDEPSEDEIDRNCQPDHSTSEWCWVLLPHGCAAVYEEVEIGRHAHPIIPRAGMEDERGVPVIWVAHCDDDRINGLSARTSARLYDVLADRLAEIEWESTLPWLTPGGSSPTVYEHEREAECRLYDWAAAIVHTYEVPAGLTINTDDDGVYLSAAGGEPYHLDLGEMVACIAAGSLAPAVELARAAWGQRRIEADDTSRADAVLAQRDVYVTESDSIASGNCPRGTALFAALMRRQLKPDGDIGAVSARLILAQRDDIFTRRACRHAALRVAS